MRCLICPDESEFQPIITDKFGRRILILRAAFGAHYQDRHFLSNASVVAWLYKHGVIDGCVLYQVYLSTATPQEHYAFMWKLIGPTVPPWLIGIMLDIEAWSGTSYPVRGDHSAQVNALYALHCHKMGSWTGCGLYGNRNDLASIVPRRDSRAWVIVAAYGSSLVYKSVRGAIGQQYSDGSSKWPVPTVGGVKLPRSTSGVACDHNMFDPARFPTGATLRAFMRPAPRPPVPPKPPVPPAPPKPPAPTLYDKPGPAAAALVTPSRHTAYFPMEDGRIDVRTDHVHVGYIVPTK